MTSSLSEAAAVAAEATTKRGGTRAHAGGSGAAVSFTFKPTYNISYSISVGGGGSGGHGDDGKHSGGDGSNGGDTNFGNIVFAGGGTGGMAIQYDGAGSACVARNLGAMMFDKNCRGSDWQNYEKWCPLHRIRMQRKILIF